MDSDIRDALSQLYSAAVAAVDPYVRVRENLILEPGILTIGGTRHSLPDINRIYVVGAGKAAAGMARAAEEVLGGLITEGFVVTTGTSGVQTGGLDRIALAYASHPVPDDRGVEAATRIKEIAAAANEDDLVICLFSGGASALMALPASGISLHDKQEVTRLLLGSGADIGEINMVRKHLSGIKGGRLAEAAWPATVSTLIISDVIGDDIGTIASGPTAPDETTFLQASEILKMRGVYDRLPETVRAHLGRGCLGAINETPKPGADLFDRVDNLVVASNADALKQAAEVARYMGFTTSILKGPLEGEARDAARGLAGAIAEYRRDGRTPACIITGGETTVILAGKGKGGRNQELALAFAIETEGESGISALFAGTDGIDGPTDAAGAFVDGETVTVAAAMGMDAGEYLQENDSYAFFKAAGGFFTPGPTGTNVMDIAVILII